MSDAADLPRQDLTGKTITTYIIYQVAERLQEMAPGQVLEVITDDFEAIVPDVRAWCRMAGVELVSLQEEPGEYRFTLARGERLGAAGKKVALVISSAGLLELLSPLGFALAAALSGAEVSIYFQGPGVRVLRRGFQARLPGLGWPFSAFARKGLAGAGHLPPQDKLRQLQQLGARFFACGPSMERFGAPRESLAFEDVTVAEYFTFMEQMQQSGILLYPQ